MRRSFTLIALSALILAAMFTTARPAVADPGIGNDAAFPVAGIAANTVLEPVLGTPSFGPLLPPPATRITSLISPPNAAGFGDTRDISYADELPLLGPLYVEFSVGLQFGGGLPTGHIGSPAPPLPAENLRQEAGVFFPPPFGDGSTLSDIYQSIGPLAGPVGCAFAINPNFKILDDDGAPGPIPFGPWLGLNMPGGVGVGNVDAYDRSEETLPGAGVRPLPATGGPAVAATGIIFFTITPGTAAGWLAPIPGPFGLALPVPGDILAWNPLIPGPVIYATAAALGLIPGDAVDALAMSRIAAGPPLPPGGPGFDFEAPGTAIIVFSLAPGSPSLSVTSGGSPIPLTPLAMCGPAGSGTAGDLWFVPAPVGPGGATPYMNAEFLGLSTFRSSGFADDNIDAIDMCNGYMGSDIDGDGIDDACDLDKDGDGLGNFIDPDDDGDGYGDPQSTTHEGPSNTMAATDNCPMVPNPLQTNTDGNFVDTSPPKVFDDITWPNSDQYGDACDTDDDNDGLPDTLETGGPPCPSATLATNPLLRDTDGDLTLDGAECALFTDPASAASKPPLMPAGDTDGDGLTNVFEATIGTNPAMADTDGDKILDGVEYKGYNSDPLSTNGDSDPCGDAREIGSLNDDKKVNSTDLLIVAKAQGSAPGPPYYPFYDVNKDGKINSTDLLLVAKVQSGFCP